MFKKKMYGGRVGGDVANKNGRESTEYGLQKLEYLNALYRCMNLSKNQAN